MSRGFATKMHTIFRQLPVRQSARNAVQVVAIALLVSSAASAGQASPAPDLSGVLALMGQGSMAQACPIAPDKAITSAHVVGDYERYMWSALGQQGLLGAPSTTIKDRFRDLAMVAPYRGTFPRSYVLASAAPQPDTRLWFIGYDFRRRRDAFAPRIFEVRVLRVMNGHVVYAPAGVPGTSGSCVLNAAAHVDSYDLGGRETEDRGSVGIAVGVWGELLELGR